MRAVGRPLRAWAMLAEGLPVSAGCGRAAVPGWPVAALLVAAAAAGAAVGGGGGGGEMTSGGVFPATSGPASPPTTIPPPPDSSSGPPGNAALPPPGLAPPDPGPLHFATGNSSSVTAQVGSTALVPCVVRNIGDGMVSWIRRRDFHLLTVGLTTYSSDERFSAVHALHSEDWTLQIKYVQQVDAGLYECQVSSHPPTSIFIDLRVVEARADILGPAEKYLKSGSTLRLSCVLRQSTEPPVFVFWYHNNRMINYDRDRGVNVTSPEGVAAADGLSEGLAEALGPDEEHASTLLIAAAQKAHSGNYSCVPNNALPASTIVHVLNAGENPAAMQHGGRGLAWLRSPSAWLLAACVLASLGPTRGPQPGLSGRRSSALAATKPRCGLPSVDSEKERLLRPNESL